MERQVTYAVQRRNETVYGIVWVDTTGSYHGSEEVVPEGVLQARKTVLDNFPPEQVRLVRRVTETVETIVEIRN